MLLLFLRHAEAEDARSSDFSRRLTPKGIEQAEKAGKFCLQRELVPDVILSSPVIRARQTADIVAKSLGVNVVEAPWLACGMDPEDCLAHLSTSDGLEVILLVGHEPDFSHMVADLIGLPDPSALKIRKASLTAVELEELCVGCGQLQFSVPARLM
jgi:phosphohistidine phosphatase